MKRPSVRSYDTDGPRSVIAEASCGQSPTVQTTAQDNSPTDQATQGESANRAEVLRLPEDGVKTASLYPES